MVKTENKDNKNCLNNEKKEENEDIQTQTTTSISLALKNKNYTPFIPKNYKINENANQSKRKNSENSTGDE